ncbi:MAG: hypothetical protein ACK58T_39080 [Phycisphaerae bacterium]
MVVGMKTNSKSGDNVAGPAAPARNADAPRLRYVDVVDLDPRSVSRSRGTPAQTEQPLQAEFFGSGGVRALRPAGLGGPMGRGHARSLRPVEGGAAERPGRTEPVGGPGAVAEARRLIEEANRESSRIGLGARFAETLDQTRRATPALMGDDARWVFAVRVRREVQGGHAALVTPESRKRLLKLANRLGLRDFDANLVIAIVQDDARTHGGTLPVPSDAVRGPLALVRPAQTPRTRFDWRADHIRALAPLVASVALAAVFFVAAVRWLLQG